MDAIAGAPGPAENDPVQEITKTVKATGVLSLLMAASLLPVVAQRPVKDRAAPAPSMEERLDLNQATLDELMKVPGMTGTWAGRILRFRPYRTKKDLLDQGIVSPAVYARIKEYLIVHRAKP